MSKLQVKKSNFLVPLEEAVSKPAQLLASYIVASLPKSKIESEQLPQLTFPYVELRKAINADGRERVNKIQDIMELGVELQKCILFYEDNDYERTVSWLIGQERNKRSNIFTYTLHPGLKKYLINIENHFTKYNYLFRVCLNAHAMKLYEILKMYQYRGEVTMHIEDDLKLSLGLVGKYPKVYDFKRRVLNVCQKEIAQYTDIRFEYEIADKKGKTPISYTFYIYENIPSNLPPELLEKLKKEGASFSRTIELPSKRETKSIQVDNEIFQLLNKWGGREDRIQTLFQTYELKNINYQIRHLQRLLKDGKKIDNPFAWLSKALKDNYKDLVQDQKEKKKAQTQLKKQLIQEKRKREEALKNTQRKYHQELKSKCLDLFEQSPQLLENTIDKLKDINVIQRALQKGETPEQIFQNKWTSWTVQSKLFEMHPEEFQVIQEQYIPVLEQLKQVLEE